MKKFTLFLMSLFLTVGAMAQVVADKQYRIKVVGGVADGEYVTIGDNLAHTFGHVHTMALDENNADQKFSFIPSNSNWKVKSGNNEYFCYYVEGEGSGWNTWNLNKTDEESKAIEISFESTGNDNEYYIRTNNKYLKVGAIEGTGSSYKHVYYDGNNSNRAKFVVVEVIDPEYVAARNNFNAVYVQANELLANAEYTKEKINLTVEQGKDGYIWTNAQEASEGPIKNLIDGLTNKDSYFHTAWGENPSITPNPGYHFIEIDLGENKSIDGLYFDYTTRRSSDDGNLRNLTGNPSLIQIYGSNGSDPSNVSEYTLINTINSGLPLSSADNGFGNQGVLYSSDEIVANDSYRHIRFRMNSEKNVWFMLGEFNLYNRKIEDKYAPLKDLYMQHRNNADYSKEEYISATYAINNAINAINTYTLNVSAVGYATLFLDFNATIPTNVEAYIIKKDGINNGYITLTQVTGVLPANTGIIVKAAEGNYTFSYAAEATANVEGNLLEGTVADAYIEGAAYVLTSDGNGGACLGKAILNKDADGNTGDTHFKNNANKAYLPASAASGAAYYSFRFGEGTTGVENVEVESGVNVIYDLTGRRVEAITAPGIYVVNGKKVLVK
ncbi:MAG: hypothetical protein IKY37_08720 [Bacteroidaceae bacterium]|nr:hypothetical protein [Bacteroidaceae bacterium]